MAALKALLLLVGLLCFPIVGSCNSLLSRAAGDPATCTTYQKAHPKAGITCNVQGSVSQPAVLKTGTAATLAACGEQCFESRPACLSVSYGPGKACTLYSKKVIDQKFKQGNTRKVFFNRLCFQRVCSCSGGLANCGGTCRDLQTDSNNCGACGNACEAPSCVQGMCTSICVLRGLTECQGQCVDTTSDSANCGTCGNQCTGGHVCSNSDCICGQDTADCNNDGTCQPLRNNDQFCGSCTNACGPNASCSGTSCVCNSGLTRCENTCVNTFVDNSNCGGCGLQCTGSDTCTNGACQGCRGDC